MQAVFSNMISDNVPGEMPSFEGKRQKKLTTREKLHAPPCGTSSGQTEGDDTHTAKQKAAPDQIGLQEVIFIDKIGP